jgi:hypothetical protein
MGGSSKAIYHSGGALGELLVLRQVKAALRELRDTIPEMLRGRRSGVAAALLAAAGRTGNAAVQADAARALASALAALQSAASPGDGQVR